MVFADAPDVLRLQPVIILKVLMVISKRDDAHGGTSVRRNENFLALTGY